MCKWMFGLAVALAFSLVACKEEEKLCEAGDERCEVGNGKCVVGYDGDCWIDQVCYAGEGAPKGKPGTCTDGQWDAEGTLTATVVFESLIQGERRVWPYWPAERWTGPNCWPYNSRDCFFECLWHPLALPIVTWLGNAPATLTASVRGPHAETAQLKASVQGVQQELCVNTEGQQRWECHFPEGFAKLNPLGSLDLNLWTENAQACSWGAGFLVEIKPLELSLEAQVKEGFLEVSVNKKGTDRGWVSYKTPGLSEVHYFSLKVSQNGVEIPVTWSLGLHLLDWVSASPDYRIKLPADFQPTDTLKIQATVSAKDLADNEVSMEALETTLEP